jgi:hypothetical protein
LKNRKHKEDAVLKEAHNCYESKSWKLLKRGRFCSGGVVAPLGLPIATPLDMYLNIPFIIIFFLAMKYVIFI